MTRRVRGVMRAVVAALLAAGLLAAGPARPVGADPQASVPESLGVLNERLNAARYRAERAAAQLAEQERRLTETRAQAAAVRERARARAALLYRRAGTPSVPTFAVTDVHDLARRTEYVAAAETPDRQLLEDLAELEQRLEQERAAQEAAKARHLAEVKEAEAARERLLEAARRAEAARAAAAATSSTGDGAGPVGTPVVMRRSGTSVQAPTTTTRPAPVAASAGPAPTPAAPSTSTPAPTPAPKPAPAPSSKAAIAVQFAYAQLGKPYAFATAGPNTFDCSGLTMAAWRAAGVSMPHYSVAQAQRFPKVTWDQLQPGDLVLYYSDLHHVGLYIGNGQMIHAPQTGDVVKIAPAWRTTFQFGVRPG